MAAVRGWRVIKMYKARGPGIPVSQHLKFLREPVCTRQHSANIHSANKYLLNTGYKSSTVPAGGIMNVVNKIDKNSCPCGAYVVVEWG